MRGHTPPYPLKEAPPRDVCPRGSYEPSLEVGVASLRDEKAKRRVDLGASFCRLEGAEPLFL
eukprot:2550757-Heterocapsa_arctica.AAC.1